MAVFTAIKQFIIREVLKDSPKGIVQTLPNKDLVELNTQVIAQKLMQNGIDPTTLKNANQVENAIKLIEKRSKVDEGITAAKSADVFELQMPPKKIDPKKGIMGGKQIDDDLPPPGSRGGDDDIAAPIQSRDESLRDMMEAEIKKRLETGNKKGIARIRAKQKMLDDAIDDASPGFSGDRKVDAELVAENLAERMGKVYDDLPTKERLDLYDQAFQGLTKKKFDPPEDLAQGGRAGFKEGSGMTRRTFLKILGGVVSIPILGKIFKPIKTAVGVKEVPVILTDKVAGKPEWFDALVNKVILEGDEVTKKFATGERQIVHSKDLGDGTTVRVTQDMDQGAVRVEYDSADNVFEDTVQMEYKKPLPDEGDPSPSAEFTTAESGPVGRQVGPDDYDMDIDEVGGTSIKDLDSDVSKLKEYATGKGPNMKEMLENINRRKKARRITEDPEAQSDAIVRRQGEMLDYDVPDDAFASGGIARMLGE
jgi:hypothetical protein